MNGFLKAPAVFIGGVIVVIDVASWKGPSLLRSNYRLLDPATDNVPPLPRKGTFAKTMWDMDHPIRRPEDYPPPSIFKTPESRPAGKVSVSGPSRFLAKHLGTLSQGFIRLENRVRSFSGVPAEDAAPYTVAEIRARQFRICQKFLEIFPRTPCSIY